MNFRLTILVLCFTSTTFAASGGSSSSSQGSPLLQENLSAAELEWITTTNEAQGDSRKEMMLRQLEAIAQELIDANINDQAALDAHIAKGGGVLAGFLGVPGGKEIVQKMLENKLSGKATTAGEIVLAVRDGGLKAAFGSLFGAPYWAVKTTGEGVCACGEYLLSGVCKDQEPTEEETEYLLGKDAKDPNKRKGLVSKFVTACKLTWLAGGDKKPKKKIEETVKEPLTQNDLLVFFSSLENRIVNSGWFFFNVLITVSFAIIAVVWCFVKNKARENSYALLDDSEV